MPQVAFQVQAPLDPFDVQAAGGNTASVSAATAITVNWDPGATSTITAETQAKTPGGLAAVDSTLDLYLIVAQVGLSTLTLVKLADALASGIDSVLGGTPSWGIIGELTHNRVREHQQVAADPAAQLLAKTALTTATTAVTASAPLSSGAEGDVLEYEHGAWAHEHIGNVDDIFTTVKDNDGALRGHWSPNLGGLLAQNKTGPPALASAPGSSQVLGITGTPVAGWQNVGFDDSGWSPSIDNGNHGSPATTAIGAAWESAYSGVPAGAIFLLRHHFTVPATILTPVVFSVYADNHLAELYFNGTPVACRADWVGTDSDPGNVPATVTIPPGLLVAGSSTNVMAMRIVNDMGPTGVVYALRFGVTAPLNPGSLGPGPISNTAQVILQHNGAAVGNAAVLNLVDSAHITWTVSLAGSTVTITPTYVP